MFRTMGGSICFSFTSFRANGRQLRSGGGTIRQEDFEGKLYDAVYAYASLEQDERVPRVRLQFVKQIAFLKFRYRSLGPLQRQVEREGDGVAEEDVPAAMENPAQVLRPGFRC